MGNGGGELTLKRQMGMDWRTEWAITGELEICSLVFYLCHSFVIVIMRLCFIIVHAFFFLMCGDDLGLFSLEE